MREYTVDQITPLLEALPKGEFHAEQVPSFAAQSIFRRLVDQESDYNYREAALNPTNPKDLADRFEVGLIDQFLADPDLDEAKGIRHDSGCWERSSACNF